MKQVSTTWTNINDNPHGHTKRAGAFISPPARLSRLSAVRWRLGRPRGGCCELVVERQWLRKSRCASHRICHLFTPDGAVVQVGSTSPISAAGFGSPGPGMGPFNPSELVMRGRTRRPLCRYSATSNLNRHCYGVSPSRHRADPAFLLAGCQAWHEDCFKGRSRGLLVVTSCLQAEVALLLHRAALSAF